MSRMFNESERIAVDSFPYTEREQRLIAEIGAKIAFLEGQILSALFTEQGAASKDLYSAGILARGRLDKEINGPIDSIQISLKHGLNATRNERQAAARARNARKAAALSSVGGLPLGRDIFEPDTASPSQEDQVSARFNASTLYLMMAVGRQAEATDLLSGGGISVDNTLSDAVQLAPGERIKLLRQYLTLLDRRLVDWTREASRAGTNWQAALRFWAENNPQLQQGIADQRALFNAVLQNLQIVALRNQAVAAESTRIFMELLKNHGLMPNQAEEPAPPEQPAAPDAETDGDNTPNPQLPSAG